MGGHTHAQGAPTASLFVHDGRGFRMTGVVCPYIVSLSDDREGNLWVGTRSAGLIQVRLRSVELVTSSAAVAAGVQSVGEDAHGTRFVVGENRLRLRLPGGEWEPVTATQLRWPEAKVTCVAPDSHGGVWPGTFGQGLFHWQEGGLASRVSEVSGIGSLLAGSNGDLWAGEISSIRLSRLRDGRWKMFELPSAKGIVGALVEDEEGTVWVATVGGLILRVKGDALVDETPKAADGPNLIRSLNATPDGSLWIGYATCGLGRLKQGRYFRFGMGQGLEDEGIFQIQADGQGGLWCLSNRGILRLKLEELAAVADGKLGRLHPRLYGHDEGWPVMQASIERWPRSCRSRSGELCFSTANGLAVVHPGQTDDPPPPAVLIERLNVNGRSVAACENRAAPARGGAVPVVELRGLTENLPLGPGVRRLGVNYNVVDFSGPDNIRFRYRMEGLDDNWVEAGPQRMAYFSQMPPGSYRFLVSASNNSGIWNDAGAVLTFTVAPYFWQTAWFRVSLWLGAAAMVGGVVWLETRRRLKRRLLLLEAQQAAELERRRIAQDLHDELGSRLAKLSFLGELAKECSERPAEVRQRLDRIADTSRNVLATLDEIVWAVNPRNDTLEHLAAYIGEYAQQFFQQTPIECGMEIPVTLPAYPLSAETRHHLFLAAQEALGNVIKHARASHVAVRMSMLDSFFRIVVADDGCEFDPAGGASPNTGNLALSGRETGILPVREDSASSLSAHETTGWKPVVHDRQDAYPPAKLAVLGASPAHGAPRLNRSGLANMRRRMDEIGARIDIRSQPAAGTTVTFDLPLP